MEETNVRAVGKKEDEEGRKRRHVKRRKRRKVREREGKMDVEKNVHYKARSWIKAPTGMRRKNSKKEEKRRKRRQVE